MIRRLAVLVSTAAALALGLAACGADDRRVADPPAQAPAGTTSGVAVTAKDLSLSPSKVRAEAAMSISPIGTKAVSNTRL